MQIFNLFLSICLLSTPSIARMSEKAIQAEIDEFGTLQRNARELLRPIEEAIETHRNEVKAPFNAEAQPIREQLDALHKEESNLHSTHYKLQDQLKKDKADLEELKEQEIQTETAGLKAELEERRKPILTKVAELEARKEQILQTCYRDKARLKGLWDGGDSLNVGLRCSAIERQIKELYQSVDGDLPARIEETQKVIEAKYDAARLEQEKKFADAVKEIDGHVRHTKEQICSLEEKIVGVYRRQTQAVDAALDIGIIGRLATELELRMVAGLPL